MAKIPYKGFGCFELVRAFGKLYEGVVKGSTRCKNNSIHPWLCLSGTLGWLWSCHNVVEGLRKGAGRVKLHRNLANNQQPCIGHVPKIEMGKLEKPSKTKGLVPSRTG